MGTDADLSNDPSTRVMVFVDGQNLYKRCKELFGHPTCHPHLLAQYLAGTRSPERVRCRFYTGVPNPNKQPTAARNLDRRLSVIRRTGVTVVRRTLNYHWDWQPAERLPRPKANSGDQLAYMRSYERPQEKGIDLRLGLDVVEFVLLNRCDVAIIVSLDRDLWEIPEALANLKTLIRRPYRLEAAVPVSGERRNPKTLPRFAFTHQITPDVFELIRDDTNYGVPPEDWRPPLPPERLDLPIAAREVEPTLPIDVEDPP